MALAGYYSSSSELESSASLLRGASFTQLSQTSGTLADSLGLVTAISSSILATLASTTAQVLEIQSAIDNFPSIVVDPLMVASSMIVSSSLQATRDSLASFESSMSLVQESSSSAFDTNVALASSLSGLLLDRSSLSNSLLDIESGIQQLSSGALPALAALASLSSRSSSLSSQLASMSSGILFVATEKEFLAAASSSARLEALSSTSSGLSNASSGTVTSALADLNLNKGLKIDLSTNGLIAVTREIANNRLAEISSAQANIQVATKATLAVQQQISRATAALSGLSALPRIQEQPLKPSAARAFSQNFAKNVSTNPNLALGAVGSFKAQAVLSLLKPPSVNTNNGINSINSINRTSTKRLY
jgi:hypothetical protein